VQTAKTLINDGQKLYNKSLSIYDKLNSTAKELAKANDEIAKTTVEIQELINLLQKEKDKLEDQWINNDVVRNAVEGSTLKKGRKNNE
jgi:peptidoglycan hydrolase CwlO-like protein